MWPLALVFAILTGLLSQWQWQRLAWKNDIIHKMHATYNLPILAHPTDLQEFRRIAFQGKWIDQPLFLKYKVKKGNLGCELIMPFQENQGEVFLVNLGWQKSCTTVEGTLPKTAKGHFRQILSSPQGTPENIIGQEWYYINANEMKNVFEMKFEERFYIEAGSPLPGIPNNHLMYALTWGLLSFIFTLFFLHILRLLHTRK